MIAPKKPRVFGKGQRIWFRDAAKQALVYRPARYVSPDRVNVHVIDVVTPEQKLLRRGKPVDTPVRAMRKRVADWEILTQEEYALMRTEELLKL